MVLCEYGGFDQEKDLRVVFGGGNWIDTFGPFASVGGDPEGGYQFRTVEDLRRGVGRHRRCS